jgi:broad specificity phosphatase PhoE
VTTFYFIRHGAIFQAPNPTDPSLSLVGWRQANATAAYLKQQPLKHIYTSPLMRAKETSLNIAAAHNLEPVEDTRLRERINWGDIPDQSFAEFVAMWERGTRDRDFAPPVGDSARQAGQRLELFIRDIHNLYPHGKIAAVTHGGLIADFLLNCFSTEELSRVNSAFARQPYSGTVMQHCSLTLIHFHGEFYKLEKIAAVEHLIEVL